jgi:predicted ArsR family transcriptional regulator
VDCVESTRSKILEILRHRHEATVEELTQVLQLAAATVRRHLDVLQRDGYVRVRPVRRETGRPHYAFSLTEAGEAYFPQHYMRVTSRLIQEIAALTPEETAGKAGHELAGLVFDRMAEDIARTYVAQIHGETLEQRLEQTVDFLANEGLIFELTQVKDGYRLAGLDCPCRHIAEGQDSACRYDRTLLSRLLGTPVIPLDAQGGCAYLVQTGAALGSA